MPRITFIEHNGKHHEVQAKNGDSLMQVAVSNGSFGILADCGGNCACATCHVYIDTAWVDKVASAAATEKEMVEAALHAQDNSRLSCQIAVTPELDGLIVHLPESQM